MSAKLVDQFLINLASRIETLQTNALESAEYQDRIYESLESDVDFCFDRIETLELDFADYLGHVKESCADIVGSLEKSVEILHVRQDTLEQRHKNVMQRYMDLIKELLKGVEKNNREVMRNQEVEIKLLKEEIRRLKDKFISNTHLAEQSKQKIRKHETSEEIAENVRNDLVGVHVEKTVRAKANITQATPANDGIANMEPPGSDSIRSTRRRDVPPPTPAPVTQERRLRKKKPFPPDDDGVVDIKPTKRYNLRSRKPRQ